LSLEGWADPWAETALRKADKAEDGRLEKAKELYAKFAAVQTPTTIPRIV